MHFSHMYEISSEVWRNYAESCYSPTLVQQRQAVRPRAYDFALPRKDNKNYIPRILYRLGKSVLNNNKQTIILIHIFMFLCGLSCFAFTVAVAVCQQCNKQKYNTDATGIDNITCCTWIWVAYHFHNWTIRYSTLFFRKSLEKPKNLLTIWRAFPWKTNMGSQL